MSKYRMENDILFDLEVFIPQVRDGKVYSAKDLMTMAQNANIRVESGAEIPVCIHHKPNKPIPEWKQPIPIGYMKNFRVRYTNHPIADEAGNLKNKTVPCIYADVHGLTDESKRELLLGNLPHRSIGLKPVQESPEIPEHFEIDHLALMTRSESPWIKFPKLDNNSIDASEIAYPKEVPKAIAKKERVFEVINYEFNVFEGDKMTPKQKHRKKSKVNEKIDNQNKAPVKTAGKSDVQKYIELKNFEFSEDMKQCVTAAVEKLITKEGMGEEQATAVANSMYQDGALDSEGNFALPDELEQAPPVGQEAPETQAVEETQEIAEEGEQVADDETEAQLIAIFQDLKNDIAEIKQYIMGGDEEETDESQETQQEEEDNFENDQKEAKKKNILPIENFEAQLNMVNFEANEKGLMYKFDKKKAVDVVRAVNTGDPAKAIDAIAKLMPIETVEGYQPPVNFENDIDNPSKSATAKGKPIDHDWNVADSKGKSPAQVMAELHPDKNEADRKYEWYGKRVD